MAKSCLSLGSGPCPDTNPVGRFTLILLAQRQSLSPLLDEPAVHQGDFAHVLQDREEANGPELGNMGTTTGPGDPKTSAWDTGPIDGDTSPRVGEETLAADAHEHGICWQGPVYKPPRASP